MAGKRKREDNEDAEAEAARPKRPTTPFFLFSKKMRPELKDRDEFKKPSGKLDVSKLATELGNLWGSLDEEKKKVYKDEAEKLKEQYKIDFAAWREKYPDAPKSKRRKVKKKGKKKKKKDPNQPKRPLTGFLLFSKKMRPDLKDKDEFKRENGKMDVTKISKELGRMWKELSDDDKKPYKDESAKLKEEYKEAMEKYKAEKQDSDSDDDSSDSDTEDETSDSE